MFYNVAKATMKIISSLIYNVKVYNREYEPLEGPVILCSNHISMMDPILIGVWLKRQIKFMAKEELFSMPILGFLVKKVGAFPISRNTGDLNAIKIALKTLKDGNVLGLFPEGGRRHNQEESKAKTGVANFSYKTKATVFPVHIICKNSKLKFFSKVEIVYGNPMKFEDLGFTDGSSEEMKRISGEILTKIFSLNATYEN